MQEQPLLKQNVLTYWQTVAFFTLLDGPMDERVAVVDSLHPADTWTVRRVRRLTAHGSFT